MSTPEEPIEPAPAIARHPEPHYSKPPGQHQPPQQNQPPTPQFSPQHDPHQFAAPEWAAPAATDHPAPRASHPPTGPWLAALVVVSVLSLVIGGAAIVVGGLALWWANEGIIDGSYAAAGDDPAAWFGDGAVYGEYVGLSNFSGVRSVEDLSPGTCFTVDALDEGFVGSVAAASCDAPHTEEAFAVTTITEEDFPGYDAVTDMVYGSCELDFADYVGAAWEDSGADFGGFAPTEEGWAAGQRDIVCFAFLFDAERTGSLHHSGL